VVRPGGMSAVVAAAISLASIPGVAEKSPLWPNLRVIHFSKV
jgi:hypothetical protein